MNLRRPLVLCLMLTACGGGGGGDTTTAQVTPVVTYYPGSTQVKERGNVITGTTVKTGAWEMFFDNGQMQWQGTFDHDAIDGTKKWREWNRDGSVRFDQSDH